MKKTRSIKTLLELLLSTYIKQSKMWDVGLCHTMFIMCYILDIITSKEYSILMDYITITHKPKYTKHLGKLRMFTVNEYWWPLSNSKPRIQYLKRLISKL